VLDLLHGVGFGLVTASILALATVGLSLQYSVTNVPNFAQGELMTLGAYGAYATDHLLHNLVLEAVVALILGGAMGWFMNHFLIQPFSRRGTRGITMLVVTLGFALVVQNSILAIFGGSEVEFHLPVSKPSHVGPFILTSRDGLIIVSAIAVLLGVHVILRYTRAGKAMRAVADNVDLARITGINSGRVIELTWLAAGAMAGFSGFVLGVQVGVLTPTIGFAFLLVVFAAAILGGIGQVYGAMLGALIIGIGMEVSAVYIPGDYKQTVAFAALILTLLFRPSGIIKAPSRHVVEGI